MRFFGSIAFVVTLSFGAPLFALSDAEICAQIMRDYGVQPEKCPKTTATPSKGSTGDLDSEIRESHIFFKQGGTVLDDAAQVQLAALAAVLQTAPMQSACIRLIGHSDTSGGVAANQKLGLRRAQTVASALKAAMPKDNRIDDISSAGETRPLEGIKGTSPLNRRVEIRARTCT